MYVGPAISGVLHLGLLALALAPARPDPFISPESGPPVAVEIMTLDEYNAAVSRSPSVASENLLPPQNPIPPEPDFDVAINIPPTRPSLVAPSSDGVTLSVPPDIFIPEVETSSSESSPVDVENNVPDLALDPRSLQDKPVARADIVPDDRVRIVTAPEAPKQPRGVLDALDIDTDPDQPPEPEEQAEQTPDPAPSTDVAEATEPQRNGAPPPESPLPRAKPRGSLAAESSDEKTPPSPVAEAGDGPQQRNTEDDQDRSADLARKALEKLTLAEDAAEAEKRAVELAEEERLAAEDARIAAEDARIEAERELAEQQAAEEELERLAEAERVAEEAERKAIEEEAKRLVEAELEKQRLAQAEKKAAEERAAKLAEEEANRLAEAELEKQKLAEEEARKKAEEEAKRLAEAELERLRLAEAEARKKAEEELAAKRAVEEEAKRLAEAEAARLAEERRKVEEEAEALRQAQAELEARRQAEIAEQQRLRQQAEQRAREEQQRLAEEQAQRAWEAEQKRRAEEAEAARQYALRQQQLEQYNSQTQIGQQTDRNLSIGSGAPAPAGDSFLALLGDAVGSQGAGSAGGSRTFSRNVAAQNNAAPLSPGEQQQLLNQLSRCWRTIGQTTQIVTMRVTLTRDGRVSNATPLNGSGLAVEHALRALQDTSCQPFQLPPQKYGSWQQIDIVFDPRRISIQ